MSTRGVSQLHFSRGSEILQVQVLTDVNCGPTPHLTEAEAPVPSIFFALPPVRPPRLLWDDRQGSQPFRHRPRPRSARQVLPVPPVAQRADPTNCQRPREPPD